VGSGARSVRVDVGLWPHLRDACALVAAAGLDAAPAGLTDATPAAITRAARRILLEDAFRVAARGLAEDIRAMPSPGDVVTELERLG
jgi:hypothetical protein